MGGPGGTGVSENVRLGLQAFAVKGQTTRIFSFAGPVVFCCATAVINSM